MSGETCQACCGGNGSGADAPEDGLAVLSGEEILRPGHLACPGCGIVPAYRWALKVLGRRTIVVAPACCFAVVDGPFPYSASGVPFLHTAFEASAAYASGVRAALYSGVN